MRFFFNFAFCLVVFSLSAKASTLELLTEDDAPHNMMKNGQLVGIATEKLNEAFKRANVSQHMELVPWARAYQSALTQTNYCAFSAARTPERENLFKWIGPIASMDWVLYTRTDNIAAKPNKLEDIRSQTVGGYLQDVISVWLANQGYKVEAAPNDAVNPKKLMARHINYWASSRPRATAMLDKEGLSKKIIPIFAFGHTDLYLACNTSVSEDVVLKLNLALKKMKDDGTSTKIDARYSHWPNE